MRGALFVGVACLGACRAPVPEREQPPAGLDAGVSLVVEPPPLGGLIQPVSRFHLSLPPAAAPEDEVLVVRGELSEYHLRKIRDRELPKTLSERLVPTRAWPEVQGIALSPLVALELSQSYSLASAELGLIAALDVVSAAPPVLERTWPPREASGSADFWLFCGDPAPEPAGSPEVHLEPGHRPVWASLANVSRQDGARCVSLVADAPLLDAAELVPPPLALGHVLEPSSLSVASGPSVEPLACLPSELPIGPGCLAVQDDRALIRAPAQPTLWFWLGDSFALVEPLAAGSRLVVRGLTPSSSQTVALFVRDVFGEVFRGEASIQTLPPAPHVVLNEVFANPLGAEPAQEWVELYNDGSGPVELSSLSLRDAGGETPLPQFVLAPGAFVLLARQDYAPGSGPDPQPPVGTPVLGLPSLGKNGLSNSGEALELWRAGGPRLSTFPASPKPKAGVSVARRTPWTLDDDPAGFSHHAAPGASPGEPNVLDPD